MLRSYFLVSFLVLYLTPLFGQEIEPENGVQKSQDIIALTNVRIVVSAGQTIEHGTLLIKNGIIQNVGIAIKIPKNAIKTDLKGFTIYPSFIDIHASEGIEKSTLKKKNPYPQLTTLKEGPYYWNQAIHPETDAYTLFKQALFKEKNSYIKQGFGTISTHQRDGILRGTAVLTTLGSTKIREQIIKAVAASHYSFSRGSSTQTYPSSQMGAIALIRQVFYDANWYKNIPKNQENISLKRVLKNLDLPQIFEVYTKLEILRALKLAKEFDLELIVKGGGDSYERIEALKALNAKLIIPVNFPKPYDVTDPYLSRFISLADLKDWEMRPYNPYILQKNNIPFCFTSAGLEKKSDFLTNIRKAVKHGLSPTDALRALTETPAKFLQVSDQIGTLEKGKIANFLIVKGDLFTTGEIYENWLRGERKKLKDINQIDIRGTYNLNINTIVYNWEITGKPEKPVSKLLSYQWKTDSTTGIRKMDTVKIKSNLKINDLQISMNFVENGGNYNGAVQLNGTYNTNLGLFMVKYCYQRANGQIGALSEVKNTKTKN